MKWVDFPQPSKTQHDASTHTPTHPHNTSSCSSNRTCSPSWLHQLKKLLDFWTWKKLVLKLFSKHTLWWNQINNWKDQHYYIPNGKVDAKFSKSLVCHMILSSCSSSSVPIRCSHIIWKERYSRSSQGDSDFRLQTCPLSVYLWTSMLFWINEEVEVNTCHLHMQRKLEIKT
jgi:hypothetical protein